MALILVATGAARGQDLGPLPDRAPAIESQPLRVPSDNAARSAGEPARDAQVASAWQQLATVGLPLAGVVAMIFGGAALWKRSSFGRVSLLGWSAAPAPSGVAEVLARYPVGRGQSLVLLRVHRRVLVVGQCSSPASLTTLSEFSQPDEVASLLAAVREHDRRAGGAGFSALMQRAGPKRDEDRAGRSGRAGSAAEPRGASVAEPRGASGRAEPTVVGGQRAVATLRAQLAKLQHAQADRR